VALPTVAINKTKIKFRFAEQYTSEASNFQAGINDIGAYRGGTVAVYGSSPSKSVRILTDGTSTVVLHRNSDGYGTVINETAQPVLDLTSAVTWPITTGGLQLYIYLDVNYSADAETTGLWGIAELGDLPDGAVRIAMLDLPESATEILDSHIRTDGSSYRHKVLGKKGILIPKIASIGTGTSRSRFLLADRVSCMGMVPDSGRHRAITLLSNYCYPLTDGSASETLVTAGKWYPTSGSGTSLGASDMDEDGCYTNPYIDFYGVATFDAAFEVAYYSFVSLDSINTASSMHGFVFPHADNIKSSLITGTSDTLTAGYLPTQLLSLLNKISGKIDTVNPNTSTGTWTLLWRSNNISSDALVDTYTLSLYYSTGGLMVTRGGYISGSDFKINAAVSSPAALYAYSIDGTEIINRYVYRSGPATLDLADPLDWTTVTKNVSTGENVYNLAKSLVFDQYQSITMNGVPHIGSNARYIQIFNLAEGDIRVYFSAAGSNTSLMICSGCYWDDSSDKWKGIGSSYNAIQLSIGRYGLTVKQKDKDDADFSTGWSYTASWTGEWTLASGLSSESLFKVKGDITESCIVPFKVVLNSGHIAAMSTLAYTGPVINSAVNFRAYRYTEPLSTDFSFVKNGSGPTLTGLSASDISHWGAKIIGTMDIIPYLRAYYVTSSTGPSTIRIANAHTANWQPGQLVCVRGTGVSDVWKIVDISVDGTSVDITVDSSINTVIHASDILYTLFHADENTEIEAFYIATVF
jgi:hypothetical protein